MKVPKWLYREDLNRGSLYGAGVFPFWIYVKYFGKPVFKFCKRKLKFPTYWAIMATNILGSAFHVGFFLGGFTMKMIILFLSSLFIMTSLFWIFHKIYLLKRKHNKF